jgi:hypothetical protein
MTRLSDLILTTCPETIALHIGMAEQTSQDVVNQTRSGGEPSSSDVPASKNDKYSAEGGEGRITKIEFKFQGKSDNTEQTQRDTKTMDTSEAENSSGEGNKVRFEGSYGTNESVLILYRILAEMGQRLWRREPWN